jgi:transposase-like protein
MWEVNYLHEMAVGHDKKRWLQVNGLKMREFAYYQKICENKMSNELIIPIKNI